MEGHMWELSIPLRKPFVNAAVTVEARAVVDHLDRRPRQPWLG